MGATELLEKRGGARVEGCEVLRWRISLPAFEEDRPQGRLYRAIEERAAAFCEGELRQRAEEAYVTSEDPKRRFRFPTISYRLIGTVAWEEGEFVSVSLRASLTRMGEKLPLVEAREGHLWEGENLLPPRQAIARFARGKVPHRLRRSCGGVLLLEKSLLLWDGIAWREWERISL